MSDLHFFDRRGVEVAEGSEESVVQYTEADAKRRGLKLGTAEPKQAVSVPEVPKPAAPKPAKPRRR